MLTALRRANPDLAIFRPTDKVFLSDFGEFLGSTEWSALAMEASRLIDPDASPSYLPSVPCLETTYEAKELCREVFGEEDTQVGVCRGRNDRMNGMEWHDSSEIILAVTPLLLLLGHASEIQDLHWDSRQAAACYLEGGEALRLDADVLHFAPCRVSSSPFSSLIVLPRGTNADLPRGHSSQAPLWKNRKWLLVHPESPHADLGAHIGIQGPNLVINPV